MSNKKLIWIVIWSLLISLFPPALVVRAEGTVYTNMPEIPNEAGDHHNYFIVPEQFQANAGSWSIQSPSGGSLRDTTLVGRSDRNVKATSPASAIIDISASDIYYVWAHTRDFTASAGQRKFSIGLNGKMLPYTFGAHEYNGWKWELGGRVKLGAGQTTITLQDISAYYPRVDAILLTTNPLFIPDSGYSALKLSLSTPMEKVPLSSYANMPDIVNIPGYFASYFVVPEQFAAKRGTWTQQGSGAAIRGTYLQGLTNGNPSSTQPAEASIDIDSAGIYRVWAYTEDDEISTGGFELDIGEFTSLETLGVHGKSGWAWEDAGTIDVPAGQVTLKLNDTHASNAKIAAILISADIGFTPTNDYEVLKGNLALSRPISEGSSSSDVIFLRPASFEQFGSWILEGYNESFGSLNLKGLESGDNSVFDPSLAQPAVARFQASSAGTYKVWVHSRDFTSRQGTRFFNVNINGTQLQKTFGTHGVNSWAWEDGGTIILQAGENVLQLLDTSGYFARTDGIILSNDINFVPPNSYSEILNIANPSNTYKDRLVYPDWARTHNAPLREFTLENEHVRVKFYEVSTTHGNVIQKQTYIKNGESFVQVEARTDEFGYLLLYGNSSHPIGMSQQTPIFDTTVEVDGQDVRTVTVNPFESGMPNWMIPASVTMSGAHTALLIAENNLARLEAEWSLPSGAEEPVVTLRLHAKQAGIFSIGMFNGSEQSLDRVDFLLNPFRYMGKRMPDEPVLVPEQTSSSAYSSMTLSNKPEVAGGMKVTYAMAVDPDSISDRWAYENNSNFGLGIMGRNRGVQPSLFAPLPGLPGSQLALNDTYTFKYRPIVRLEDWFDTYRHVTQTIMGLKDYRKNVAASLTDTILNVQDLMMDDNYGGWDENMKAHYNMEAQNVATQSSPMAVMQSYLLTEDNDIYESRVVPTLENLLTRESMHFTSKGNSVAISNLSFPNPLPIGTPVEGFGTSVFGGLNEMARGLTPALREVGVDQGKRLSSGNATTWSEDLWMYRFTGDHTYLEQAMIAADAYMNVFTKAPPRTLNNFNSFINVNYYPSLNGLLDLYEISGEVRYLEGAKETARRLLTTLKVNPIVQGEMTIDADEIRSKSFMPNAHFWWKGESVDRLGFPQGLAGLQDASTPAWVPSPVGLGIEQASSFMGTESGYITMSNWAPDLMRLAKLTGDETFEMAARNAILGRGANYPGYYQNQYMVHQKEVNYPYTGPDLTNIYYHHIPVYYGVLTDFLFAQAWNWSNGQIQFPFLRQQGYSYFNNRQFGSAPGSFFGENNMWPWLKKDLVNTGDIQIDWLAARKDGMLGVALMNEDSTNITTTVTFGQELGGASLEGSAALVDANGNRTQVIISSGKLTLTIPAKGIIGIIMEHAEMRKPAFADIDSTAGINRPIAQTVTHPVTTGDFGLGFVIQVDPSFYHAYTLVTDMPDATEKVRLHYRIGDGEWQQVDRNVYPYEFSIKVESPDAPTEFYMDVFAKNNTVKTSSLKQLRPYSTRADIIGFHAMGQNGNALIDPQAHTVTAAVYNGTDVSHLEVDIDLSEGAHTLSPAVIMDFSSPVQVVVQAENGRKQTWTVVVTNMDQIPPITTDNAPQGWTKHDIVVTLNAVDQESSVLATYFTVNGGERQSGQSVSINTEGTHNIDYWSVDAAGNLESAHTVAVNIDKTAPVTTVTYSPSPDNGWQVYPVTVSLSVYDNLSGMSVTEYSLDGGSTWLSYVGPIIVAQEQLDHFKYRSQDQAGNVEMGRRLIIRDIRGFLFLACSGFHINSPYHYEVQRLPLVCDLHSRISAKYDARETSLCLRL
ncbi:OmpL47-type beta-barrel domain-containing protein [Paenibacillus sp. UNC451MF]|uniref:OmpL47-type beta-barrel domain-containing protein n=1 Tax=Paenibacillus sp. UNC451MF TaxID=1449063 RepID=UPI00048C0422|nr:hypothetical protein [Paenibacillus sp. UNC451MF]